MAHPPTRATREVRLDIPVATPLEALGVLARFRLARVSDDDAEGALLSTGDALDALIAFAICDEPGTAELLAGLYRVPRHQIAASAVEIAEALADLHAAGELAWLWDALPERLREAITSGDFRVW